MPRPVDPVATGRLLAPIVEALGDALSGPAAYAQAPIGAPPQSGFAGTVAPAFGETPVGPTARGLQPGSAACREVEKAAALVGAILASERTTGFDLAALFFALRTSLAGLPVAHEEREALGVFAEWLAAVAFDAFAAARAQAERERSREQREEGTPVVLVTPELPAAFLIGRPDGPLMDSLLSRLLLLVVRVGARVALIHAGGLADQDRPEVMEPLARFAGHKKIAGTVHLLAVGVEPEAEKSWRRLADDVGAALTFEGHFDAAVERGIGLSGYRLVRSS
jgi:hypothetical protein